MLHYVQFIEPNYGDAYDLTTDGALFLEGEIDARYQPHPAIERVLRDDNQSLLP